MSILTRRETQPGLVVALAWVRTHLLYGSLGDLMAAMPTTVRAHYYSDEQKIIPCMGFCRVLESIERELNRLAKASVLT